MGQHVRADLADDAALIATIDAVNQVLSVLVDSPRTRGLRAEALRYEKAMRTWASVPPTHEERATMMANVHALHESGLAIRSRHASLSSIKVPARG